MPIYEFYCADCHTIFNFFSYRINIEKRPPCPYCKKRLLDRIMSRFSVIKGSKEKVDTVLPEIDETKMEKTLSIIEQEAQNMNEEDPRQAAQLMRKVCDAAGMNLGSGMEEAISRMEAGENPDKIEEDMGDLLRREDFLKKTSRVSQEIKKKPPHQDEKLYYL